MSQWLVCSVSDDKPVQEEDWVACQHPECPERRRASKVRTFKSARSTQRTSVPGLISLTSTTLSRLILRVFPSWTISLSPVLTNIFYLKSQCKQYLKIKVLNCFLTSMFICKQCYGGVLTKGATAAALAKHLFWEVGDSFRYIIDSTLNKTAQ